jgi:glutathione S-transferase
MNKITTLPILYSLRNCPFAMRARLAIFKAKQSVNLRDVILSNKPIEMLQASPKGTVPILVTYHEIIDESLDIMLWAFAQNDTNDLLHKDKKLHSIKVHTDMMELIAKFDVEFKLCLENYKCAKRYHESNLIECRQACEKYIEQLERQLNKHQFLMSNNESLADIALLPFIRQFARIERQWYLNSPYPKLRNWLNNYLQSSMFTKVMAKYPLWKVNQPDVVFNYE